MKIRMTAKIAATLAACSMLSHGAMAASSINPSSPAQNAPLASAPVRQNFTAAYNDINNILTSFYGPSAPANPSNLQTWANSTTFPIVVFNYFNAVTATWVPYSRINVQTGTYIPYATAGSINATFPLAVSFASGIPTFSITLAPVAQSGSASDLTSGILPPARIPSPTTSTFGGIVSSAAPTNQFATGVNTSGVVTYAQPTAANISGLGTAATQNTGTSGTAIPLLSNANTWSAAQTFGAINASSVNGNAGGNLALFAPTGFTTVLGINGVATMLVQPTIVAPSTNNAVSLGTSGLRWANVNSVLGNFSGTVTAGGLNGAPIGTLNATAGNVLLGSGTALVSTPVTGAFTLSGAGVATLGTNIVTDANVSASAAIKSSKCAFQPTDAGGVSKGCDVNFEAGRTVLNFGAVADGTNPTPTDNTAAFEAAALSGQIEIPQGYFYVQCSIRITNVTVVVHGNGRGQSIVYYGGKGSGINATNGKMDLAVCPGRSTVLGGAGLSKFGYAPGTYTAADNVGTALTSGGSPANPLTPLNALDTPFVAGDTITVNGATLTIVAANSAVTNQVGVNEPLWRLWDAVDTLACNGMLFCVNNTDQTAGFFRVFGADNFEVQALNSTNQAGRVFDIAYPEASIFGYQQAYIKNIHVPTGSVVPSFRSFAKVANVWFPAFIDNYFTGTPSVPRSDGSYFFHFAGGHFASIGAEISGEYSGSQFGIVSSGYVEGLHIRQRTEFIGPTYGIYIPASVPLGGAASAFAAQALWWDNLELNVGSVGINITNVHDTKGRVHISGTDPNFIGFNGAGCVACQADMYVESGASNGVGLALVGGADNEFHLLGNSLNSNFATDGTTARNHIYGHGSGGGHPDAFSNPSLTNVIDWQQTAAPTLSGGATLSTNATDRHGTISVPTSSTSTVLTFTMAKANNPDCTVTSPTGATVSSSSAASGTTGAAKLTINYPTAAAGAKYSYTCGGS